jgi:hypothetical protein
LLDQANQELLQSKSEREKFTYCTCCLCYYQGLHEHSRQELELNEQLSEVQARIVNIQGTKRENEKAKKFKETLATLKRVFKGNTQKHLYVS